MTDRRRHRLGAMAVMLCLAAGLVLPPAASASAPSNDNFANAQLVTDTHGSFSVSGDNTAATTQTGEPLAFSNEGTTVWYQWTASADGTMQVDTIGSEFDTQLGVYTGTDMASLTQIAKDDDSGGNLTSLVTFTAQKGTTYSIQVGGFNKDAGSLLLNGTLRPPNDDFSNATPISGYDTTVQGTTWNATPQTGEPTLQPGQGSVWYTWQTPFSESAIVLLGNPDCSANAVLVVGTGSDLTSLTGVSSGTTAAIFTAQAGQTYDVMVATVAGGTDPACDFGIRFFEDTADLTTSQHGKTATTVGTTVIDTVSVTNGGPSSDNQVTFDDTIPSNAVYLGVTPPSTGPNWLCNAGLTPDGVLQCTINGLGAGQTTKAVIRYVSLAPASLDNAVTASGSQGDPNTANTTSDLLTTVTAAPKTIYATVDDNGFTPAVLTLQRGWTVFWQNTGTDAHTVTDNTGLGLFDLLGQAPPSYGKFTFNGAGVYSIVDTPTDDDQMIKVPMAVAPATGDSTTRFVVTWAANNPPDGYIYDIDIKRPGSTAWVDWQTTSAKSATFIADAGPGKYTFRARLRKLSSAVASGWVTKTITVTP
jgi:uncharacterized repeat protein (TIGR01451 family)